MGVVCGKNKKAIKQDQCHQNNFQSQNTLITFGCSKNQQPYNIRSSQKQQRLIPLSNIPGTISNQKIDNESKQLTRCKIETISHIHNKSQTVIDSQNDTQNQTSQGRLKQQLTQIQSSSQNRIVQFDMPEQQNQRTYYIIRCPNQQH